HRGRRQHPRRRTAQGEHRPRARAAERGPRALAPAAWQRRSVVMTSTRVTTAYHESGHAVAAVVLGLGVEAASIMPTAEWVGHVDVPVPLEQDRDLDYWVRRATMTWAGPLAGSRYLGARVDELDSDDRAQIRVYAMACALGPGETDAFAMW